ATLVAPLPASIVSTVIPSALKYPFSCAMKNGACVPWMIQSRVILTFLTSAFAPTAPSRSKASDKASTRGCTRSAKNFGALPGQRPLIIDDLHPDGATIGFAARTAGPPQRDH